MKKRILILLVLGCNMATSSCEDFVDIDTPNFQIVSEDVFKDQETAQAAMQGIYNQLRPSFFTTAASTHMGMSGNLLQPRVADAIYDPFYQHELSPQETEDATSNLSIWSSAYNLVYLVNSLLEGIENSSVLSEGLRSNLRGQALFVRAFTYFYLTNFYGDVPLLLTTDYQSNAITSRMLSEKVWEQIESDLDEAIILLENNTQYPEGERFYVTQNVAIALRSRTFLYQENWIKAEEYSSRIISQTSKYNLSDDLEQVFMTNNEEVIWHINPGGNFSPVVTAEGVAYILRASPLGLSISGKIIPSDDLLNSFENGDKRFTSWINTLERNGEAYQYIYKYKRYTNMRENITESSVTLRLAEQYLIRSEARVHLNKLDLAINDIDVIRQRAGIGRIAESHPEITNEALLDTIMEERKKELFGEYGHRWLDLKRTGRVSDELGENPSWQDTDIYYPIPETERLKNPNLGQNDGY